MKNMFMFICAGAVIEIGVFTGGKINDNSVWNCSAILFVGALIIVALLTGYGVWKIESKENTRWSAIATKLGITDDYINKELHKK